jgi:hypothetical protein
MKTLSNNCPICNKERFYKSKSGYLRANKNNLPCRSCSNSIQLGGSGNVYNENGEKLCIDCKIHRPIHDFHKNKKKHLNSVCINCSKNRSFLYHKSTYRYMKYGITKEDFDKMILSQNNNCAICNKELILEIHIDHDHSTNKVRGILCGKCNKGLGQFDDNVEFLTNAIKYLKNE